MARKNYKITLILTPYGADDVHNPNSMATRITHAIEAAKRHNVRGRGGQT